MAPREFRQFESGGIDPADLSRLLSWLVPVLLVVFVLSYLALKSYYTVEAHEQAVVLRFGKYHATTGPGLHFMIPLMDRVVTVSSQERNVELPLAREMRARPRSSNRRGAADDSESLMLTGDLNAGIVEWTLQYQVVGPDKYLFSISERHISDAIKAVAQSVMHRLVGDYSIDEVLTEKRAEVAFAAERATQEVLDSYDCGVQITGLQMQRVTPPARVKPSFDRVNESVQKRIQLVNEANRARHQLIPQAKAKRDRLIQEARGYADRRRAEAQGEIAALLAKYDAYREAPKVTRQRLYLEAIQEVLSGSGPKVILDGDLKGLLPLLELGAEQGSTGVAAGSSRKEGE